MKKSWILAAFFAVAGLAGSASASTVSGGANPGTITIAANGSISVVAPSGTYDGVEDVVYNVTNNSSILYTGFTVTGVGIAGFDGDGIDNYASPTGADLGHYGQSSGAFLTQTGDQAYAGWANGLAADANVYSGYVAGGNTVVVTFGGGGIAANGGTAFISFEAPGGAQGNPIGVNTPLPPAVWSGLALVLGIGAYTKFAKSKIA